MPILFSLFHANALIRTPWLFLLQQQQLEEEEEEQGGGRRRRQENRPPVGLGSAPGLV